MIFIWGTNRYGRTDEVPALFHVTTRFGHLWYVPLIPLGSFLLGWLRAGTLLGAIILGIAGFAAGKAGPSWNVLVIAAASLIAFFWLTYSKTCRHASYSRAVELAKLLGMNEQGMMLLDRHFGRVPQV